MKQFSPPLRKARGFFLLTCMLLFVNACKKDVLTENLSRTTDLTTIEYRDDWRTDVDYEEIGETAYERLEAFATLSVKEGEGLDFYYDDAFPNGTPTGFPDKEALLNRTWAELQLVLSVPYDEYLNTKVVQGAITTAQKAYLTDWYNELAKLDKLEASDGTYLSTINSFNTDVTNDNALSTDEKQLLHLMATSFKHVLQYFQENGPLNLEFSNNELQARSGCSLKNVLRIFRGFNIIIGFIQLTSDTLFGNGSEFVVQDVVSIVGNYIAYLGGFVTIIECILVDLIGNGATWLWSQISSGVTDVWCWLFGCDEIECNSTFNVHPTLLGCNSVELTVHGAGSDIVEFVWVNVNATPATASTTSPVLAIAAINPSLPVTSSVTAVCSDDSEAPGVLEFTVASLSNTPPPSVAIIEGPTTVTIGQTFRYYVSQGAMGVNTLSWSAGTGGSIVQTGSYWADINF